MADIHVSGNSPDLMGILPAFNHKEQSWHCYNSPTDIAEFIADKDDDEYHYKKVKTSDDSKFYGTSTQKQALDMCRDGWQDGVERVSRIRDKIAAKMPVKRQYVEYGVAGAIPNVQRFLAGNPAHMKRLAPAVTRSRPVLTLVNHMGGLAGVPKECFVNKCAVVAAIVDSIESSGYSCHVIGTSISKSTISRNFIVGAAVTVKHAGESVDLGKMAFALGHVAMFRRLVFALRATDKLCAAGLGRNEMGTTIDFQGRPDNVFILPSMNTTENLFRDEYTAETQGLKAYIQALKDQGCPAFRDE